MRQRHWLKVMVIMMAAFMALTGCSSGSKPAASSTGPKTITVAQGVDATTLDPQMQSETPTVNILGQIYDTLLIRDDQMKIQPGLALSVTPASDTVWDVTLRPNVKFHNGEELNADCVKYTLDRLLNPAQKSPQIANYNMISKVEVVDPLKLKITTSAPYPVLPSRLAELYILPAKYAKEAGDAKLAKEPIGTGPFKFVEWVKNDHVTMSANKDYWGGAPKVDKVVFRAIPEASTRMAELQTGAVDIIVNVPPDQAKSLAGNSKVKVQSTPSARVMYLSTRADTGATANPKVRQAISYAIDRDSLVKNILGGYGIPVGLPLPKEFFGYDDSFKPYPYDPEKAKALLAEAGFPNGLEIDMGAPSGRYLMDKEAAEAITGQLAKVGIKVNLKVEEWGVYVGKVLNHQGASIHELGWGNTTFDADGNYYPLVKSGERLSYYNNKQLDDILVQARSTMDQKKRAELYNQANKIFSDEQPMIMLWQNKDVYGTSSRLQWAPRADERISLAKASVQ